MVTISVPITDEQERFIKSLVKSGRAANKAHAVRFAIQCFAEEEALRAVRESQADARAGRIYSGDLKKLIKKVK